MRRNRKQKKQRKIIIASVISLLCIMTAGYSAFQTNLNITAKGTIKYRTDFYVSTNGSDEQGNGTITKPYKTINKAYKQVKEEATIYIMDTITQNETIRFTEGKNIHLTSYQTSNAIKKGKSLSDFLILQHEGNLTLSNVTIDGNNISDIKGGIWINNGTVNLETNTIITNFSVNSNTGYMCGGGIRVEKNSTLNINGGTISNNSAPCSGGVHNVGTTILNSGLITRNQATTAQAGGIYITSGSNFLMENGTISFNTTPSHGGGALIEGKATINGGTISNNTSSEGGAFKATAKAVITINNGKITNNKSTNWAGGIMVYNNAVVTLNGGEISNNTASSTGGGVCISGEASLNHKSSFTLNGGSIKNNTASTDGGINKSGTGTYTYIKGIVCGNRPTNAYEKASSC